MLPWVFSLIDHRRRQNVVRTSVTHSAIASCSTFLFLPHFDVICDLLLNRRTATWNLFVNHPTIKFTAEIQILDTCAYTLFLVYKNFPVHALYFLSSSGHQARPGFSEKKKLNQNLKKRSHNSNKIYATGVIHITL